MRFRWAVAVLLAACASTPPARMLSVEAYGHERLFEAGVRSDPVDFAECLASSAPSRRVTTTIAYDVDPNGRTRNVRSVSSDDPCLDRRAIAAVRDWQFEPPIAEGQPVQVTGVTSELTFCSGSACADLF